MKEGDGRGGRKEVGLVLSIVFWNSTLLTLPKHITKATFVTVSGHNRHSIDSYPSFFKKNRAGMTQKINFKK